MSDPRYIKVALEVFDLHHSLGHSAEFEACVNPYCRESTELVRQHAMAELFKSRMVSEVRGAMVEAECEETDYDTWGDHDGTVRPYRVTSFILGKRPTETILLCESHRHYRQAETAPLMKGQS